MIGSVCFGGQGAGRVISGNSRSGQQLTLTRENQWKVRSKC